jgi:hypothetical protein
MSFLRTAAARRIFYALLVAMALFRFAKRAHSESLSEEVPVLPPPPLAQIA